MSPWKCRRRRSSTSVIKFADGTQLEVQPDSLVTILESPESVGSQIARVEPRIDSGEANFRTGDSPEVGISLPKGRAIPGPQTEGRVQNDERGAAVEVRKGSARVETETGQEFRLSPNEGVRIDPEGVAGPKTTLPPAPVVMDVPRPPGLLISSRLLHR
jgi:ferric-dicitrate binding protein FerR (iron transport regulator)